MKQPSIKSSTDDSTEVYNLLYSMFSSAYLELREMAKKAPKETLSSMKVTMLNRILEKIRSFLSNEPSIEFLDLIDDVTLPNTSDTVLLMSQYDGAFENFYKKHNRIGDNKIFPNFSK